MNLEEEIKHKTKRYAFMDYMDVVIEEERKDYAVCSLVVKEKHLNAAGFMSGAAGLAIAEITSGVALTYLGGRIVALDLNYKFLRPVKLGEKLIAKAETLKVGGTIVLVAIDLMVEDRKVGYCVTSIYRIKN